MHGCFAMDASAWEWLARVWAFHSCKPLHWAASRQLMPVPALPLTGAHMQDMVRQRPPQQPGRVLVGGRADAKPHSMRLMQESGNTGASTPLHVHSETH